MNNPALRAFRPALSEVPRGNQALHRPQIPLADAPLPKQPLNRGDQRGDELDLEVVRRGDADGAVGEVEPGACPSSTYSNTYSMATWRSGR
jgi:hypothetical protein